MRPTTVLSLVCAALLGAGALALSVALIVMHHDQSAKWHYWLAPFMMIGAALTLWQLTAMYMTQIGKKELRSRPPTRD